MKSMMGSKTQSNSIWALLALGSVSGAALLLSGCGAARPVSISSGPAPNGAVHGGQQPVAFVNLQLYTVGSSGYGSAASPLGAAFQTTAHGNFNFPTYTCPGSNPEVFLLATGGTPVTGSPNPNLAMMAGLGPCTGVASLPYIDVDELTTVATVWSLSGFMTGPTNIGAPASNLAGLTNAFAAINKVVDIGSGTAGGPALPTGATLPSTEINALGNILQNCINSSGGSASDSSDGHTYGTSCGKLFYLTKTSTAPTDTVTAALNIAQHPSMNVAYLNDLQSSTPAFLPALDVNTPPTDWTISINYIGGGLKNPQSLAVDASANVWVTNPSGNSVTELSNTGAAISGASGFTAGATLNAPYGIAIDQNGYAWITNSGNNSITQLAPGGATYNPFSGNGLGTPYGIAIDGADNVWVVNSGGNTLSGFSNNGSPLASSPYSGGGLSSPASIAVNPK
jgi:sugar lactone lactonase YvrE